MSLAKSFCFKLKYFPSYQLASLFLNDDGFFYHNEIRNMNHRTCAKSMIRYMLRNGFIKRMNYSQILMDNKIDVSHLLEVEGMSQIHLEQIIRYYVPTKKYLKYYNTFNFQNSIPEKIKERVKGFLEMRKENKEAKKRAMENRKEFRRKLGTIDKREVKELAKVMRIKEISNKFGSEESKSKEIERFKKNEHKINYLLQKYSLFDICMKKSEIVRKELYNYNIKIDSKLLGLLNKSILKIFFALNPFEVPT